MIISNDTHIFRFRGDNINTINEMVNNTIWHSKHNGLNDPFELYFTLDNEGLKRLPSKDIAKIIQKSAFLEENRKAIERCFAEGNLSPIYPFIYQFWGGSFGNQLLEDFQKSVALACFTKTYDSRLMWGYYGNGMRGICFAYNKEKLKESDLELEEVHYSDEVPKIDIYKHLVERLRDMPITLNAKFSLRKHSDWAPEQEVRSLKYLKGEEIYGGIPGFAVPLKQNCIDAVIVGERLTGDMRSFIESFTKKNGIQILIAKADLTSYKIHISE
ncbi:DUF2971 domain-containing protein [Enterobacter asburiae]|uniref:DUF2971 domain-containing protein n=1 Tax=Enterobacter asburiae TaxID=61645 RepID=UPI001F4765FB|nr:DUF2971 domain-containing protein [Enterobacter asburiae]MCF1339493.1 DUF2971 domain-containing protein [Enterobacter asburiae]MCQ4337875.1 DUF2971 domain-containing protein [Enterobacter asburiae]HDC4531068.1 DUF2971 domain-containing protein [Enterobacter asburiae]